MLFIIMLGFGLVIVLASISLNKIRLANLKKTEVYKTSNGCSYVDYEYFLRKK